MVYQRLDVSFGKMSNYSRMHVYVFSSKKHTLNIVMTELHIIKMAVSTGLVGSDCSDGDNHFEKAHPDTVLSL